MTALPPVEEEGLGTNPLVGQALVVMMAMHKNHLQRVVVGAMDSLHQQQNHMYYSHQPQMEELNLVEVGVLPRMGVEVGQPLVLLC